MTAGGKTAHVAVIPPSIRRVRDNVGSPAARGVRPTFASIYAVNVGSSGAERSPSDVIRTSATRPGPGASLPSGVDVRAGGQRAQELQLALASGGLGAAHAAGRAFGDALELGQVLRVASPEVDPAALERDAPRRVIRLRAKLGEARLGRGLHEVNATPLRRPDHPDRMTTARGGRESVVGRCRTTSLRRRRAAPTTPRSVRSWGGWSCWDSPSGRACSSSGSGSSTARCATPSAAGSSP